MRLIDADALKLSHCKECTLYPNKCMGKDCDCGAIIHINEMPTIDAVPVIRCKDCNWFRESNGEAQCVLWNYETTNKNAFCFYGSRKHTGADYAGFEVYEAERPE